MKNNFKNADAAFRYYKDYIKDFGCQFDDTQALFNIGFYINNPMDNLRQYHRDSVYKPVDETFGY